MKNQLLSNAIKIIYYLIVVFLPTQLSKHFWLPANLINGLRVDYLSISVYFTDLLILVFLILLSLKNGWFKTWGKPFSNFFLLWTLLQLLWVPLVATQIFVSIKIFLFLIFTQNLTNLDLVKNKNILKIFSLQLLLLCLLVVGQLLRGGSINGPFYFLGERHYNASTPFIAKENISHFLFLRPYATFSHPNTLAGYVVLVFWWIFYFFKTHNKKEYIYKSSGLISGLVIILLSFSHSALLTMFAGLLIYIGAVFIKKLDVYKIITSIICILSLISPIIMLKLDFLSFQSVSARNILFNTALKKGVISIFFGGGWYADIVNLANNHINIDGRFWIQPVHNSWWFLIFSFGILPLLAFCVLFRKKVRFSFLNNNPHCLIILLILILGSFDHYWITQQQTLILLCLYVSTVISSFKKGTINI
jgi:hypothetical protein